MKTFIYNFIQDGTKTNKYFTSGSLYFFNVRVWKGRGTSTSTVMGKGLVWHNIYCLRNPCGSINIWRIKYHPIYLFIPCVKQCIPRWYILWTTPNRKLYCTHNTASLCSELIHNTSPEFYSGIYINAVMQSLVSSIPIMILSDVVLHREYLILAQQLVHWKNGQL